MFLLHTRRMLGTKNRDREKFVTRLYGSQANNGGKKYFVSVNILITFTQKRISTRHTKVTHTNSRSMHTYLSHSQIGDVLLFTGDEWLHTLLYINEYVKNHIVNTNT